MNSCVPKLFGSMTPPQFGVEGGGPVLADALAPVVLVREAPARPAHVRHLDRLERGHDVVADAAGVGDGGVGTDPDALVDAGAEVLGELAEDVPVDLRARLRGVDRHGHGVGGRRRRAWRRHGRPDRGRGDESEAENEAAAGHEPAIERMEHVVLSARGRKHTFNRRRQPSAAAGYCSARGSRSRPFTRASPIRTAQCR